MMVYYRSFTRDVLLSNLLLLLRVNSNHVSKYQLLSQLEYSYLYMNTLSCFDVENGMLQSFYDLLFLTFTSFFTKFWFSHAKSLDAWDKKMGINYINKNRICLEMVFQHPKSLKSGLKKSIEMIFNLKIPKVAEYQKLKSEICDQISKLDEQNPLLMLFKARDTYNFIRYYLLKDPQ